MAPTTEAKQLQKKTEKKEVKDKKVKDEEEPEMVCLVLLLFYL